MHPALVEGISDAVGFVGGALLAFWIARLIGWDLFAEGYGARQIAAILMVGLGGGFGLQVARRWRASRMKKKDG